MADLNMNTIIHAAVRRDLARMHRALAAFPAGDQRYFPCESTHGMRSPWLVD